MFICEDSTVHPNAQIIGKCAIINSIIGPDAVINNSCIIESNVEGEIVDSTLYRTRVHKTTHVRDSMINDSELHERSAVYFGCNISNCIVGKEATIKGNSTVKNFDVPAGCTIGEHSSLCTENFLEKAIDKYKQDVSYKNTGNPIPNYLRTTVISNN